MQYSLLPPYETYTKQIGYSPYLSTRVVTSRSVQPQKLNKFAERFISGLGLWISLARFSRASGPPEQGFVYCPDRQLVENCKLYRLNY